MIRILIFIFSYILLSAGPVFSQEKQKFLTFNGYLSSMQSVIFDSLSGPFVNENLLHNRLNLKGLINENITFAAELRNRLFTGDMVRSGRSYSEMTESDQGWVDMSWNILNKQSFFLNTTIDRLWMDFNYGKFQARIGRQRINWGQTLVWNPNDIFNAYSFFDFDYVERPGSDAVRLQYYPDFSSAIELAVKADYMNHLTTAAIYRFNKWGYDIQFLAGYVNSKDVVVGSGWSGAIGSVSFRGEASWFQPAGNFLDSEGTGLFTIGFDKVFKNNSVANMQVLFCNNPMDLSSFSTLYSGNMSAKDLAFSRFSSFGQFSYPVTPLLTASASAMWFPDLRGYFAGPSLDYSLAENIDFSLIWQHFESENSNNSTRINLGFLRLKYNF
ncbi:MAG: hypothetical protein EPN88_04335 [Bacteroidetes bacterium]|nr:MAG: hypothetical protein EPN88_04335 [Bacteroidota bacterium]